MPSVTFLVAIDVPDTSPSELALEAEDILDDLSSAGHAVISAVPWARPTNAQAQPAGGFTSLNPGLAPSPPPL